ncbi:MAG: hypothetical protein HKN87_03650 [Saprospiraceae bacterium]|nr:hypothetical protein [Saprospiraceae bacterium]
MKYCLSLAFSWILVNLNAQLDISYEESFQQTYAHRIKQTHINGKYIPKDVEDAVARLNKIVDPHGQARFKAQPEEKAVRTIHFSFGRWMIFNWGFYEGSRLSHFLRSKGITYPDDMASTLMHCYHRRLNDKPLQLDSLANHFASLRQKEVETRLQKGEVLEKLTPVKN